MTYAQTDTKKNIRAVSIGGFSILLIGGFFVFKTFFNASGEETLVDNDQNNEAPTPEKSPTLSASIIRQKLLNGERVVFLDVRDQASFDAEHIPHSTLISPANLSSYTADSGSLIIIVLSATDASRREAVANILKQVSYPAFILEGGIEAWREGGNQALSYGDPDSFLDQSKVTYISPADAQKELTSISNIFILDVQSPENFEKRHLRGAVNIPLDQIEKRSREIPSAKNILVYGESELISFRAGVRLSDLNIFTAKTLRGNSHLTPGSGFILEP